MKRILAVGSISLACAHGQAAVTTTMIDLPLPGSPRILDVRPANAVANIISIPGSDGVYGIVGNDVPSTMLGRCDVVARNTSAYADHGYAVVLVDRRDADIAAIIGFLQARDHLPMWIVSGSAATAVVVALGASIPAQTPMGLVIWSPTGVDLAVAAQVTRPTQVVFHADDSFAAVNTTAPVLYAGLTSATVRELVAFGGGIQGGECFGYHTFVGLDPEWIATSTGFIAKYMPVVPPAGPAAVEYFNAGFGHYFMTSQADEIAGLDAGAFNFAFVRTGKSFKVHDAPAAGTVPVCRFFTTPGTFGAKSSHFYTANPAECDGLKLNPNWIYEKIAFHIGVPAGGVCAAGTVPVYRMYNHGQTGAPNHRFTTDLALYQQFTTTLGWDQEGIAFCAPA